MSHVPEERREPTTSAPLPDPGTDTTWFVIPLFNEGPVIHDVITQLRTRYPLVVCVDDGSDDDSAEQAEAAGAVVVRHPYNMGQGAALKTGIDYALQDENMRQVVTFDADGQHQVDDAASMIRMLHDDGVDVVLGSRFLDTRTKPGLLKRIVLKGAIVYENLTTGVSLTDAHNGLRVLGRTACEVITIEQNRMAHASEIPSEIHRHGLTYKEHPVHILYTDYSRAKGQSVLNSINIVIDMILR
ncbi:glycosyltransferase family 2 protein [Helcobacillus massiliensis]|uniref:Glycosyltransferase involved in cell wall biosynthesis n=1 Tax=Helcobacillus massiliensis TaxID=521392 RepID=A0A839QQB4_9MICO|nr:MULTISPECIES: glycosyltransferase family 2 protein [Helcobacillus]MBB3021965.1 glycosyltransferase involved in cell wall biosynthesis [Helcobacillus massiliensis]MCG7426860.1 glycosyltransferase family 2 protein [Helcobacillus sp. ACRRO]MCT1557478.1 glycosyltransferase family 2 protein [Helcobacillus massiliensis]MCT2036341.1 glycosyltransferase family 2 protein [Helcobacillus massiliensis]MCT2331917.1 glycosyltransferase family 2 protein [Helcobacillus massiliensis]